MMLPEQEDGNIEYKLKLMNDDKFRIERLASQMRFRCNEGCGECIYNLGVEDDGTMSGIKEDEFKKTMKCITSAAEMNSYLVTHLTKTLINDDKYAYELLIREINDQSYIDVKVAIAGSVDCGKSTLLSVLTNGKADDGRGSARLAVFNFPHEIVSGRTSSIGHQILGYDMYGNIMNYKSHRIQTWPNIVKQSSKIISLFDLAGHEKYLKTTIYGLASGRPDICFIMVGANRGVLKMTVEHIFLCKNLNIPFCIIITKIDMTKEKENVLEDTLNSIYTLIRKPGIRRIPIKVKTHDDIVRSALNIHSESIVPIFSASNVTLDGIKDIHTFLNLCPKKSSIKNEEQPFECHIDTSWNVQGVGTVIGGHIISGKVKCGDKMWFGPNDNKYVQITIRTLHCKKVSVQEASNNSYVCMAVRGISKENVNKGNVVVEKKNQQILCERMIADVEVLVTHSTTIKPGYQPLMHASNVRTCVEIEDIRHKVNARSSKNSDDNILRTGDTAEVTLKIVFRKQFVKAGTTILLCEGRTKVVGYIKSIY